MATSDDGGATFSAPVQVNAVAGDGRVSGEMPPRVALHARAGRGRARAGRGLERARTRAPRSRLPAARDFGRTFAAPASLQAPGARGRARMAFAGARRRRRGARAVARSPRPGGAPPEPTRRRRRRRRTTAWPWRRSRASTTRRTARAPRLNARSRQACATAARRRSWRCPAAGCGGVAPRVCRQHARHGVHGVARRRAHVRAARARQRRRLGDQRLSRRRAGAGRRARPPRAHRLAHRDSRRRRRPARCSTRPCATTASFAPRTRVPTLGSPKPSHPQVVVDARGPAGGGVGRVDRRRPHGRLHRGRAPAPTAAWRSARRCDLPPPGRRPIR